MKVGDYIRFNYRELNAENEVRVNRYEGYVTRLLGNRFVLCDRNGFNPMRFERIAIVS